MAEPRARRQLQKIPFQSVPQDRLIPHARHFEDIAELVWAAGGVPSNPSGPTVAGLAVNPFFKNDRRTVRLSAGFLFGFGCTIEVHHSQRDREKYVQNNAVAVVMGH